MIRIKKIILGVFVAITAVGCANVSHQYFDSAINDKNRAPASLLIPKVYDDEVATIDPLHNQAEADFLFLKSEVESNLGKSEQTIELLRSALVYDPEAVTVMQKLAIEYYKAGKINEAVSWAQQSYKKSPHRRDISLLMAGLYTSSKEYVKAEEIYKKLKKNDSEDFEAALYLGAVYTEQKNYNKAIEIFKALTKPVGYASKYLAHYYLARVYSEKNKKDLKLVTNELQKSIALKPEFLEAVTMLGQIIEKSQSPKKSFEFFADYQHKHGPNAKVAEVLAQHYITENNYDKAYEQLQILDDSSDELIQVKLKMALILIEKKIYDKAIVKLEQILELAPESDKVRFYLSAVYEEQKNYKSSYEQYMLIAKDSSYFEDARLHAAYLSRIMLMPEQALLAISDVFINSPKNPQSYFLISQLYEDKLDYKKSVHYLKMAEQKFPKNSQVFYQLGLVNDKMNLKDEMIISMQKVLEIDSEHAQAMNYLAYTWAERKEQLELAENYARKAVLKESKDPFILDTLGWVLFKKGEYKEAVAILEKAHEMQPDVSIISEHLGDVYAMLKWHDKAISILLKAVSDEEDVNRKKEINIKLTQLEAVIKNLRTPSSIELDSNNSESP